MDNVGNFRINMMYQKGTVAGVVRFISSHIPPIDTLNVPSVLKQVVMEKRGLILVVGATGSTESTTLSAMLDFRNQMKSAISSHSKIRSSSFSNPRNPSSTSAKSATFAQLLKPCATPCARRRTRFWSAKSRDFYRNHESAMMYSLSGHLCLATLHANNSYHALNRIINFFPLDQRAILLSVPGVSLKYIISQRLIQESRRHAFTCGGSVDEHHQHRRTHFRRQGERNQRGDGKSLTPGSQTFEQDLFPPDSHGKISVEEGWPTRTLQPTCPCSSAIPA